MQPRENIVRDGDRYGRESLRLTVQQHWDSGDLWGSALGLLGGACDVLNYLGRSDLVPTSAGYRPSIMGSNPTDTPEGDDIYWDLNNTGTSIADVAYWATVLSRFADMIPADRRY